MDIYCIEDNVRQNSHGDPPIESVDLLSKLLLRVSKLHLMGAAGSKFQT